jgi:hypothetical protein
MSYEYSLSYQRDSASGCQSLNGVEPEGGWDIDEVSMDISMDIDVPGSSKGSDTPSALPISSVEAAPPRTTKRKATGSKGSKKKKKTKVVPFFWVTSSFGHLLNNCSTVDRQDREACHQSGAWKTWLATLVRIRRRTRGIRNLDQAKPVRHLPGFEEKTRGLGSRFRGRVPDCPRVAP